MVVLASPGSVGLPASSEGLWVACQHTWYGWDGSEWDLSHGLSGLALQAGVRGMRNPPHTRYSTKPASVAGTMNRGQITDEREVFWPLKVWADGSQDWSSHNDRFWDTLPPDRTGRWVITQPSGRRRTLDVRYTSLEDDSDDIDPGLVGWAVYGIHLIAEQPYWYEDAVTRSFTVVGDTSDYYGGPGGGGYGPPYYTTTGSTTDSASIPNLGDVPAWPVWTVRGPFTACTVGLNGHPITFPALSAGQWIRIDTAPTDQVARDQSGADRTAQLTAVDFTEVQPGTNVPLTIAVTGSAGSVDVSLTPLFRRGM